MNFINQLQKLPIPNPPTISKSIMENLSIMKPLLEVVLIVGIFGTIISVILYYSQKTRHTLADIDTIFSIFITTWLPTILLFFMTCATGYIDNSEYSYIDDHQTILDKVLPTTNNKITLDNRHYDTTGKSGITISYQPDNDQEIAIATVINKKYHSLNRQGDQYKQLMNQLFKITKGKNYSLLKISDTPSYNLKMKFIYQNKTYQLSFKDNQLVTIQL